MAWTKARIAIVAGIGVLLLAGIIALVLWPGDPQKRAEAKAERLIEKQLVKPVDLKTNNNSGVSATVPSGFHVFNNVPLQIDGMICLWGEGGVNRGGANFPKEILDIPVNERFQTLYIYHGSYFGSPPGTPVCEVVLRFADGTSVTNQLLYDNDILDWFAAGGKKVKGPTGSNSKLAWLGQLDRDNGTHQVLRHCLTAIENPEPTHTVASIDLYSSQSRTVVCIMAMTTGKTGLMKDATPTDDRPN